MVLGKERSDLSFIQKYPVTTHADVYFNGSGRDDMQRSVSAGWATLLNGRSVAVAERGWERSALAFTRQQFVQRLPGNPDAVAIKTGMGWCATRVGRFHHF